jgi:DNA-binding response OmpR family regulator
VVEDDRSVARMLRFSLESAGFVVTGVATGREALRILEREPPEAVVLDLGLNDGLGGAGLARLRSDPRQGEEPPFWLAISALDYQDVSRLYGSLDHRFLAKPFDPWQLIRLLEERPPPIHKG